MFPDSPFAVPVGSFQSPVAVVNQDPATGDLVQICVNRKWIPLITGALTQLLLQSTWDTTDPDVLALAQMQANELIYLIGAQICTIPQEVAGLGVDEGNEEMIRQNPENPCELQSSVDGATWCTWADLSKCMNFGTQPGAVTNQPQPGGGTQNACSQLFANGFIYLPTAVNTGDNVLIQSADGAGNDGVEPDLRLPNGNIYFAGLDAGFPTTSGSDPVPTANHMSLILVIFGSPNQYLALQTGVQATIPSGVVNQSAAIQVNDDALSNNNGSYSVCYEVTNNKAAQWCIELDFTLSGWGFSFVSTESGQNTSWIPGTGWSGDFYTHITNNTTVVSIQTTLSGATNISSVELIGSCATNGPADHATCEWLANGSSVDTFDNSGGGTYDHIFAGDTAVTTIGFEIGFGKENPSSPNAHTILSKAIIKGTGTKPTGLGASC